MLVASPSPNTLPPNGGFAATQRRSSQWETFHFTEVVVEPEETLQIHHQRPRRNSLRILTQEESLKEHLVPKRRKLVATMHAAVAFVDLLKQVREKRLGESSSTKRESSKLLKNDKNVDMVEMQVSDLSISTPVKSLRFSVIEVRQYDTILDVNPGSARGPALGIGWHYLQSDAIPVDVYERRRPPRKIIGKDFRPLSSKKRIAILKEQGYSDKDIEATVKSIDEARKKRRETYEHLRKHHGVDACEEKMEAAALRLQRITRMRRNSAEEIQQLWEDANSPKKNVRKSFSFRSLHVRPHRDSSSKSLNGNEEEEA